MSDRDKFEKYVDDLTIHKKKIQTQQEKVESDVEIASMITVMIFL